MHENYIRIYIYIYIVIEKYVNTMFFCKFE